MRAPGAIRCRMSTAMRRRVSTPPADPRLAAALAELRAHDREALLLFAWAELSYEEISLALSIPVGTVRSRLHRARRTLRGHLESEEKESLG
jgi:RNA polymerase sigma-70 factor (ECF subfamily)